MAVQRKIFISYRRADNPDFADRVRDWFIQRYGRENVFMDFDSIPPGVKFADHIRASMQQSDAVIAIIGPDWLKLLQEKAARFEDDFVRIELALALELKKPITPICISGASVPPRDKLPPDLRPLLDYNIAFLDRTNFYERIERIIAAVEAALASATDTQALFNSLSIEGFSLFSPESYTMTPQEIVEAYQVKAGKNVSDEERQRRIDVFSETVRLNPDNPRGYYQRALVRDLNGDPKGALADYQKYLELSGGQEPEEEAKVEGYIRDLKKKLGIKP